MTPDHTNMRILLITFLVLLTACSEPNTVTPGRGAEKEVGRKAKVHPSGEEPRVDRHGLWKGMNGDQRMWEVRYTRGNPTGPYREWNEKGELIATWPYNWDGQIEGWVRFYENGEPIDKFEIIPEDDIGFDPIGQAAVFLEWLRSRPENSASAEEE
jgi:hypothetical protein